MGGKEAVQVEASIMKRKQLLQAIMLEAGQERKKPEKLYLTKRELITLLSYMKTLRFDRDLSKRKEVNP